MTASLLENLSTVVPIVTLFIAGFTRMLTRSSRGFDIEDWHGGPDLSLAAISGSGLVMVANQAPGPQLGLNLIVSLLVFIGLSAISAKVDGYRTWIVIIGNLLGVIVLSWFYGIKGAP